MGTSVARKLTAGQKRMQAGQDEEKRVSDPLKLDFTHSCELPNVDTRNELGFS